MRRAAFITALAAFAASFACNPAEGQAPTKTTEETKPNDAPSAPLETKVSPTPAASSPTSAEPPATSAPSPPSGPRVFIKTRNVWVRSAPSSDAQWIGALWWGGSVRIRGAERKAGAGCADAWVPIEPRGWVCVDGERATLDETDPVYRALVPLGPRLDSPWPHRYAITTSDVRRFETLEHAKPFLEARRGRGSALTHTLAPDLPRLPKGLSERRDRVAARSAFAFTSEGDAFGVGLLLAADLSWVPKGDVTLVAPSQFQGLELKDGVELPIAFFRRDGTPKYRRDPTGAFVPAEGTFPKYAHALLEAPFEAVGRTHYYRVKGSDLWVSNREAVIPEPERPRAAVTTATSTALEISILGGWLVAFSGEKPVYVTMISAGRGGGPVPGRDLLSTASTPKGSFEISSKLKTATMESSGGPIVHGDVPWTQNFSGPHAIHSAYWHDDFGQLKSAGCVNVSPKDGQWLFDFTEPRVPPDWHAVKYLSRYGGTTRVVLHD